MQKIEEFLDDLFNLPRDFLAWIAFNLAVIVHWSLDKSSIFVLFIIDKIADIVVKIWPDKD